MSLFSYVKSLIASNTGNSAKSFSLVFSSIMGGLLCSAIVFILVWDVVHNGHVMTDLEKLGLFLLCVGAYITGSGVPKIFGEKYGHVIKTMDEEEKD